MNRDELIEVGAKALTDTPTHYNSRLHAEHITTMVLDAVLPLIDAESEARRIASEVYDDEGVDIFMTARNRVLDGRPIDLIARGEGQRVIEYLNMLADGNFA